MALSGKSKFDAFAVFCRKTLAEGTTSPKQLARLAERSEPEILTAVIANPATRIEDIEHLVREADCTITELTLSQKSLPLHIALKFAEHPSIAVRATAARCLGAPALLLDAFAEDPDVEVRIEVAQNPTAPAALLTDLAQDFSNVVRETVARNPSAPTEALWRLIADPELTVRSAVARRPQLPADLFRALSQDRHEHVRCTLAKNETLSESELECLSQDSSDQVRRIVARLKLSSDEWLAKMSPESVLEARRAAEPDGRTLAEVLRNWKFDVVNGEQQSPEFGREISAKELGTDEDVPDSQN